MQLDTHFSLLCIYILLMQCIVKIKSLPEGIASQVSFALLTYLYTLTISVYIIQDIVLTEVLTSLDKGSLGSRLCTIHSARMVE